MDTVEMDGECMRSIQESKTLAGIFQSIAEDCKVIYDIVMITIVRVSRLFSSI